MATLEDLIVDVVFGSVEWCSKHSWACVAPWVVVLAFAGGWLVKVFYLDERGLDEYERCPGGRPMTLRELEAKFLHNVEPNGACDMRDDMVGAAGVMFLCPKCFAANGGNVGTHSVICWFVGKVPDDLNPKPGRWHPSGTGLDDLTFVGPGAASVLLTSGCGWHGFVANGSAA